MFERYSEQARRAIFCARFEAIHRRADQISTPHLLLGLSWEERSRANAVGALKDNLTEISAAAGLPLRPCTSVPYGHNVDLPLSNDSKKALAYAALEADRDGVRVIDTHPLLRGILRFQNEASHALKSVSLDLRKVRAISKKNFGGLPAEPINRLKHLFLSRLNASNPLLIKAVLVVLVMLLSMVILRWVE